MHSDEMYSRNKLMDYLGIGHIDIEICDVTLRDGEQTPGVAFTKEEKMDLASELDSIGIEVIEAGFPVVSSSEKEIVKTISNMGLDANICCLSRSIVTDVDAALECDVDIVSIFIAMSDLHLRYKYHKSCHDIVTCAMNTIEYAKDHGLKVRFAAEDATRTDVNLLQKVFHEAEKYNVEYVSIADTIGILNPSTTHYLVSKIKEKVKTDVCIHCHDDLGLATANTLAAAEAGAKQLHTTVNGIGERAGNAALEEVLVALRVQYGLEKYDISNLNRLSRKVENYTGLKTPVNKAVVGKNAFTHESGIHVMAILEEPRTYELFSPEMVGGERNLIVGKHTGMKALKGIIKDMGYSLEHDQLCTLIGRIKNCTDLKKGISRSRLKEMILELEGHESQ
ncbi:homocitrate synthase family protein [Methanohalophilus sp.]|uniref:homocitrate synthase family protein n=1 Tax=Methanohalophilus sp. TaxID=1966352 RepID=UPI00262CA4BB|nr:homocitrate synthase family protein [Methanohalophilus sp.]MDK2891708.1 methanogen homocitrate synthase [Methanohalophilus sp.]